MIIPEHTGMSPNLRHGAKPTAGADDHVELWIWLHDVLSLITVECVMPYCLVFSSDGW